MHSSLKIAASPRVWAGAFRTIVRRIDLTVCFLGTIALFKDLLLAYPYKVLWADHLDAKYIYWTVSWGYHILFEAKKPWLFWHANTHYPYPHSLASSDALLSLQLLFAPLRALGFDTLTALYLSLALTVFIACLLTRHALLRIGGFSPLERALIVFSAHFSLSMVNYVLHYQLFGFHLAVPFFLFLYLYLRDYRLGSLIACCLLYLIGAGFAIYVAPMLFTLGLLLALPFLIRSLWREKLRTFLKRVGWQPYLVLAVAGVLLYFGFVQPYQLVDPALRGVSFAEIISYSATPLSLIQGFSLFSYWYRPNAVYFGYWESAYFPGYILLSLGLFAGIALGVLWVRSRLVRRRLQPDALPCVSPTAPPSLVAYSGLLLLLCVTFSWGPYLHLGANTEVIATLPYAHLARLLPGLGFLRAPGRFGMFIGLPLVLLLLLALRRLQWKGVYHDAAVAVLLVAVAIEALPKIPLYAFDPDPQQVYSWVAENLPADATLVQLPAFVDDHMGMLAILNDQLVGSTYHWAKMLAGYGVRISPYYHELLNADWAVAYHVSIEPVLALLETYQIDYLLVDVNGYSALVQLQWQSLAERCPSVRHPRHANWLLIRLHVSCRQ